MPAFATRTSTGPCPASAAANAASTAAGSRTSHLTTVRPGTSAPDREVTVTASPAAASLRAIASPIPRLPPVTRADRLICGNTSRLRIATTDPGERTWAASRATTWDRLRCVDLTAADAGAGRVDEE